MVKQYHASRSHFWLVFGLSFRTHFYRIGSSVNHSFNQSINQSVSQSINQSINHFLMYTLVHIVQGLWPVMALKIALMPPRLPFWLGRVMEVKGRERLSLLTALIHVKRLDKFLRVSMCCLFIWLLLNVMLLVARFSYQFFVQSSFLYCLQEIISDDDNDDEFNILLSSSVKKTKTPQ